MFFLFCFFTSLLSPERLTKNSLLLKCLSCWAMVTQKTTKHKSKPICRVSGTQWHKSHFFVASSSLLSKVSPVKKMVMKPAYWFNATHSGAKTYFRGVAFQALFPALFGVSRGDLPQCGQRWELQWHPICQRQRGWAQTCQSRTLSPDAVGYCWPGFGPNFHFQCAPAAAVVGQIFDRRIHVTLPVTFFSNLSRLSATEQPTWLTSQVPWC